MELKPRVGISACLLGQRVRHNGEDKRNDWIVDYLGKFVTWVPLCPELEMGLGVPRSTMRLEGRPEDPRLIVRGTEENLTGLASETARRLMARLVDLDSYIFKKDSPSCGLERVKVYDRSGSCPARSGVGLFAREVRSRHPEIPMIEEGRLSDHRQREHYAVRLFACHRLRHLPRSVSALQAFHQSYKLLLMAHAPDRYQALGEIAANPRGKRPGELVADYAPAFLAAISRSPTRRQWINVLQHIFGYFKRQTDAAEKRQVLATIEEYRIGELPLIAPLTVLRLLTERHSVAYLANQKVFHPYPRGLLLTPE